jgi:hypothetical protein
MESTMSKATFSHTTTAPSVIGELLAGIFLIAGGFAVIVASTLIA